MAENNMTKFFKNILNFLKNTGIAFILAILGCIGGQGVKMARRIGIPIILTILALVETKNLWVLTIMFQSLFLSMGYGIPDVNDEGSALGRFWYKIFKGNTILTNIFTRGSIGFGLSLSLLILPILNNNWLYYIIGSLGIILVWAINSWRGYGSFTLKLFGKNYECLKVDFVTYLVTAICELLVIYGG